MAARTKFTESERGDMWQFLYQELRKKTSAATSPCGLALWEKYISLERSKRSASNLASHFRKQMQPQICAATKLNAEQKIFVCRQLNYKLDTDQISLIESQGYKIEFRHGSKVPVGIKKVEREEEGVVEEIESDEDASNSAEDVDVSLDFTPPPASRPPSTTPPERAPSRTRGLLNLDDSIYDPNVPLADPEGLNFTRQGKEAMAKAHVRHSLGCPVDDTESGRSSRYRKRTSYQAELQNLDFEKERDAVKRDSFDSPMEIDDINCNNDFHEGRRAEMPESVMQEGQGMLMDETLPVETPEGSQKTEQPLQKERQEEAALDPVGHNEGQPAVVPVKAEIVQSIDQVGVLRQKARAYLTKAVESNLGHCDADLKDLIEKGEVGIYDKAKNTKEYMGMLKAKADRLVKVIREVSETPERPHPSIITTPTFTLQELGESKIERNTRERVIMDVLKGVEELPTVMMAKLCHFIDLSEPKIALEATDEADYRQRWSVRRKGILKSLADQQQQQTSSA